MDSLHYQLTDFLPTTKKECMLHGWDELDVILFSGDAYIDHPSFGVAVIGRSLEAAGYRVAIVPQPDWHGDYRDFKKLGRPRLFFGISPGCMDSMVNKYTANRRLRAVDEYSPDGRHDCRPEYPTIVYSQILKQLYPDVPGVLGGIEASMRRLTHYDYWQDRLRPSILCDSKADLILYGSGAKSILQLCRDIDAGRRIADIHDIPQTVKSLSNPLKVYKEKAKMGKIIFNDPVATWNHANVRVKLDANNNVFPNKEKAKEKIDVFASQLDAFICYENFKEDLSYYFD